MVKHLLKKILLLKNKMYEGLNILGIPFINNVILVPSWI
jgi:hypothetical protein